MFGDSASRRALFAFASSRVDGEESTACEALQELLIAVAGGAAVVRLVGGPQPDLFKSPTDLVTAPVLLPEAFAPLCAHLARVDLSSPHRSRLLQDLKALVALDVNKDAILLEPHWPRKLLAIAHASLRALNRPKAHHHHLTHALTNRNLSPLNQYPHPYLTPEPPWM